MEAEEQWIKTSQELPSEFTSVIVKLKNGFITTAQYCGFEEDDEYALDWRFDSFDYDDGPIMYWRPLLTKNKFEEVKA